MTDFKSSIYEAVWSSDGKRAMTADTVSASVGQAAPGCSAPTTSRRRPMLRSSTRSSPGPFSPESWSPDMTRVAGAIIGPDGLALAAATMDFATKAVRRLDIPILPASGLPDCCRMASRFATIPRPNSRRARHRRCRHGKMDDGRGAAGGHAVPPERRRPETDGRARGLRRRRVAARDEAGPVVPLQPPRPLD